jgi:hypothetical protein
MVKVVNEVMGIEPKKRMHTVVDDAAKKMKASKIKNTKKRNIRK